MGVVLGYLFICSGSILVNVCAHFFNNAIVVVLYLFYHKGIISVAPTDPLSMPWHVVVLCTVGALLLFVVYFAKKTSK
jgi:membrane protease YdiL (CAAX protease family)